MTSKILTNTNKMYVVRVCESETERVGKYIINLKSVLCCAQVCV